MEPEIEETPPRGPRIVVGLGNPGGRYAGTRHNVGFDVLDLYAHRLRREPEGFRVAGQPLADVVADPDGRFVLVWPLTYMNLSGRAVAAVLHAFAGDPAQMLVVTDDFHLPLGALRARARGSSGGHNGLRSIEQALGHQDYPRLRLGVGDPGADSVEFVLDTFRSADEAAVEEMIQTASEAAEDWAGGLSVDDLQTRYNRRKPQA